MGSAGRRGWRGGCRRREVERVVDATHPFAARISQSARTACAAAGVPLETVERAGYEEGAEDDWRWVDSLAEAARAAEGHRVLLTTGRLGLDAFATTPRRLVPDPLHHAPRDPAATRRAAARTRPVHPRRRAGPHRPLQHRHGHHQGQRRSRAQARGRAPPRAARRDRAAAGAHGVRRVVVIGVGAGDPDQLTFQGAAALAQRRRPADRRAPRRRRGAGGAPPRDQGPPRARRRPRDRDRRRRARPRRRGRRRLARPPRRALRRRALDPPGRPDRRDPRLGRPVPLRRHARRPGGRARRARRGAVRRRGHPRRLGAARARRPPRRRPDPHRPARHDPPGATPTRWQGARTATWWSCSTPPARS